MAAVRNLHIELGFDYPSGPTSLLTRVMRGISRSNGRQRCRLPTTHALAEEIMPASGFHATPTVRRPNDAQSSVCGSLSWLPAMW